MNTDKQHKGKDFVFRLHDFIFLFFQVFLFYLGTSGANQDILYVFNKDTT